MSKVTDEIIDNTYDAINLMRMLSQRLSEGGIDDNLASEMSWLLGSTKRRLEPVINVLEQIENQQTRAIKDAGEDLELLTEIMALTAKFQRRRQELEGAAK
ncbi:hypothetical protein [Agrobacterium pusense]|jgi:hypothetical protein|uniref:hypothetical protein n=1 Tax=Agrobacterium pusense TaxID=648995 RepID=UPI0037C04B53